MGRQVLLIGDTKSFMVSAIVSGLQRENFSVLQCEPSVNEISRMDEVPDIWVCYLDGELSDDFLVYCKDEVAEKGLSLFFVGSHEELESAQAIIPAALVRKSLERPLNIKDLTAALETAVEEGEAQALKKRILIVDDDPTMTRTIKNLLSPKYHVFMASSGMNAITFLAKNTVDLILLDYEMPVISGAKVLEMIRSEPQTSSIPVMFLTGKSDRNTVMEVLALKPVKYLLKSMKPGEWIREIDLFFAERGT